LWIESLSIGANLGAVGAAVCSLPPLFVVGHRRNFVSGRSHRRPRCRGSNRL